jgi:hypothetical protein
MLNTKNLWPGKYKLEHFEKNCTAALMYEGKSDANFCRQVAALVPRYVLQLLFSGKSQSG